MSIIPGPEGRHFATRFVPAMFALGTAGGFFLAWTLHDAPVDTDFWKQLLTITGLSALPLVVLAMRTPAFATANWRTPATLSVIAAFVVVLVLVGICLYEIANAPAEGVAAQPPDGLRLAFACGAAGAVLAAIACGVVVEFFREPKTMERTPGRRHAQDPASSS